MTLEDIRTGCRAGILRDTTKSVVGDCPKAVSSSLKNGKKPPFGQNGRVKMKTNTSESTSRSTAIYELDGRPPITQAFPLGLQQLLAMFVGNIVPMLLVSGTAGLSTAESTLLLQCSLLGAGVATLIQAFPIKFGKVQIGQLRAGSSVRSTVDRRIGVDHHRIRASEGAQVLPANRDGYDHRIHRRLLFPDSGV